MSFDIFDESYYLANNPDVKSAVDAGAFSSGREHFELFGLNEGRTNISSLYNEQIYLLLFPDVAAAVNNGLFSSGLQHFGLFGEAEGRIGWTGLYNEQAYLLRYPDVAAAVNNGLLSSGLEHFATFVLQDSATESRWDALYNEQFYLAKYPDVSAAVQSGGFASGFEHFLAFGLAEGRDGWSYTLFNEGFYLFTNPDVAAAVQSGGFASGLEHFASFGQAEGRSSSYFNEEIYLLLNPDVANAVAAGILDSGAEHFIKFGQYESSRAFVFTGANRNDTIRSFGALPIMSGVSFTDIDPLTGQITTGSVGTGEFDILTGFGDISDTFIIGNPTTSDVFYQGNGDSDYALIKNFDPSADAILLAGTSIDYVQQVVNGSLNISSLNGDLVAIAEGVGVLLPVADTFTNGFFLGNPGILPA